MFNTNEELLQAIELGEDSVLELKRIVLSGSKIKGPKRDDVADEMAAFANAKGGVMVLGVDDKTRDVLGIPLDQLDSVEDMIREVSNDAISPPLLIDIRRLKLPDSTGTQQNIIRIDIDRSLFVHESRGRYWVRVGSSKRKMSPEYLGRLMQQRSQATLIRFDEQVVSKTSMETLDSTLTERYRTPWSDSDRAVFLQKLSMMAADSEGVPRATVCGVLLGCPAPQDHLPHAYIQAVAYRGTAQNAFADLDRYQRDARDIYGPIDRQVNDACHFVDKNMFVSGSKSTGRSDTPQFDITAVFEALVNAVAHRDYAMHGSKIRLHLFADQLRLHVPGALPNSMDIATLAQRQSTRNEAVTSLLARTPIELNLSYFRTAREFMMDRRGEGVNQILQRSRDLSGRLPTYEQIGDGELLLTIYAAGPNPVDGAQS